MSHITHKPDYHLRLIAGTLFAMCLLAFTQTVRVSSDLLAANAVHPQTYYISAEGTDANSGTSPHSPWQSLANLPVSLHQGDSVLLNQRDVFAGLLQATIASTNPGVKVGYYSPKQQ